MLGVKSKLFMQLFYTLHVIGKISRRQIKDIFLIIPPPFSMGVGAGAYSITAVRTYIRPFRPVRPVRNTNGFRAISFEKIGVLD